jgi:hypothetical protein
MHGRTLILNTAQIAPPEFDQKTQYKLSNAMGAILPCGGLDQSYGFEPAYADRPLSQYRISARRTRSAEYKCRKILPFLAIGLPSRNSPRLRSQDQQKVRLRQGFGATVLALLYDGERRLEVRGFEPLAFSLRRGQLTS